MALYSLTFNLVKCTQGQLILRNIARSGVKFSHQRHVDEKDRIFTIPNWLCVGRIAAAPYLAYTISNGDLKTSLAIFSLAGASDLVRCSLFQSFLEVNIFVI